jgi:hypothetical protein
MAAHQFCRRRPRNRHPRLLTSRRTARRRRQRSPYRQFGREYFFFRPHAAAPAPPQCRRLVLRPGGLDQPSGARSATGDRRNGHPGRPPPNRPRPGWPALFGLFSQLPAGAEVRRPSDLHRPSMHPQGRPKQPRQTKQRAETAKASSDGQDTKQRPQRLTRGENRGIASPEPTGRPPHASFASVAPPSHRTKRITAVVPPASRSAGSSSSSDRPRARPRQPPKQPSACTQTRATEQHQHRQPSVLLRSADLKHSSGVPEAG